MPAAAKPFKDWTVSDLSICAAAASEAKELDALLPPSSPAARLAKAEAHRRLTHYKDAIEYVTKGGCS